MFLTHNLKAKVADFGLSTRLYKNARLGAYQSTVPLRWAAIEVLNGKPPILEKSDVWSYGVFMWEIFTLCSISTYENISNLNDDSLENYSSVLNDLVKYFHDGKRLEHPSHLGTFCPNELYDLMLWCWEERPHSRPTFEDLKYALQKFELYDSKKYQFLQNDANSITEQCQNPESQPFGVGFIRLNCPNCPYYRFTIKGLEDHKLSVHETTEEGKYNPYL